MVDLIKKIKLNALISAIISIVAGIILIIWPETAVSTICKILGIAAVAIGLCYLIDYVRKGTSTLDIRPDLAQGVMCISIGLIVFFKTELFVSIVPAVLGFLVIMSGAYKFQKAFDYKKLQYTNWVTVLVIALINIVFGFVLVLKPFSAAKVLFMCIGIGFTFSGLTELFIMFRFKNYKEI